MIMLAVLALGGCTQKNPLLRHYESNFTDINYPFAGEIRLSKHVSLFGEEQSKMWEEAVKILAQHALVIRTNREEGTIFFLDVDGVLRDDEYIYLQFPFTVLIEEQASGTAVYIYPMLDLVRDGLPAEEFDLTTAVSEQKSQEFLEQLSVQLEASDRWPWLVR